MDSIQQKMDSWLVSRSGRNSWRDAIEQLVASRFSSDCTCPPIDPLVYAHEQGLRVVVDEVPAARLDLNPYCRAIRLPRSASRKRQRFCLAHELAHLLFIHEAYGVFRSVFEGLTEELLDSEARSWSARLEQYCDVAARAILIPPNAKQLTAEVVSLIEDWTSLIHWARDFDVEPCVLFERIMDLFPDTQFRRIALFRFCSNPFSGQDAKWRLVSPVSLNGKERKWRLWENTGLDQLGIELPTPENMQKCDSTEALAFRWQGKSWRLKLQWRSEEPDYVFARIQSDDTSPGQRWLFPVE